MNSLNHVAIIMDGNGRWGLKNKKSRNAGHKAGLRTVEKIIKESISQKIKYLTLYVFSTENWRRPKEEVSFLLTFLKASIQDEIDELVDEGVRLKFLGDLSEFDSSLLEMIHQAELKTTHNDRLQLNIMLNYGGRREILDAVKAYAQDGNDVTDITEQGFYSKMSIIGDLSYF